MKDWPISDRASIHWVTTGDIWHVWPTAQVILWGNGWTFEVAWIHRAIEFEWYPKGRPEIR